MFWLFFCFLFTFPNQPPSPPPPKKKKKNSASFLQEFLSLQGKLEQHVCLSVCTLTLFSATVNNIKLRLIFLQALTSSTITGTLKHKNNIQDQIQGRALDRERLYQFFYKLYSHLSTGQDKYLKLQDKKDTIILVSALNYVVLFNYIFLYCFYC